jgi:hypothetical protein
LPHPDQRVDGGRKNMRKGKLLSLFAWQFFTCLVLTFFFMASLLICISNFVNVSAKAWFWCCVGIVIFSVVIAVLMVKKTKQFRETRFSFWLGKNSPKLLLSYFLTIFALVSIKSEPTWDASTVYDMLSLQWTIFGLSLTIFLVWNVIIVEFLKNMQPKEPDSSDLFQKYKLVLEKKSFSQEIETTFSTIVLLTINLFLLLLSTSLIYISAKYESIITQNILRFTFFFTTNSILCLFFDLLKPLKKDRAEMLKHNHVTKEDIDKAQAALFAQAIIEGIEERVMSLDPEKYTEEEKKKLIAEYLETFRDGLKSKDNLEQEK